MVKKCVKLFQWMLITLGISGLCLFAIPLIREKTAVQYILAAVFWSSLIAELALLISGNHVRKQIEKMSPHMKQKRGFGKVGILCFMQNKEAKIVDALLAGFLVYMTAILTLSVDNMWLVAFGITGVYLLFHLHCILNGILYKSIKHYQIVIYKRREQK